MSSPSRPHLITHVTAFLEGHPWSSVGDIAYRSGISGLTPSGVSQLLIQPPLRGEVEHRRSLRGQVAVLEYRLTTG